PLNGFMKFCIQFATPLMLIMVMAMYIYNYGMEIITCANYEPEKIGQVIFCRGVMALIIVIYAVVLGIPVKKKTEN
ncbi:MAG: hypothetical protein KBT47_02050, partial [Armatimonadetes bacterium]|nr:hypothetical protein [Candidatus Hippobium faecium]